MKGLGRIREEGERKEVLEREGYTYAFGSGVARLRAFGLGHEDRRQATDRGASAVGAYYRFAHFRGGVRTDHKSVHTPLTRGNSRGYGDIARNYHHLSHHKKQAVETAF